MALINTTTTGVLGSTFYGDGTGDLTIQQNGVLVNKITSNGLTYRGTGSVLQVVQATSTVQSSITSTSAFVATSLAASITPTSSTSKILAFANGTVLGNQASCQPVYTIYRGATNLGDSARGLGQVYSAANAIDAMGTMQYLDSPATTSSTTYTVYMRVNLGTGVWGHDGGIQVMTLMEIAG